MALIKCLECNNEISDKAEFCPKCGFPIQQELKKLTKLELFHTLKHQTKK